MRKKYIFSRVVPPTSVRHSRDNLSRETNVTGITRGRRLIGERSRNRVLVRPPLLTESLLPTIEGKKKRKTLSVKHPKHTEHYKFPLLFIATAEYYLDIFVYNLRFIFQNLELYLYSNYFYLRLLNN